MFLQAEERRRGRHTDEDTGQRGQISTAVYAFACMYTSKRLHTQAHECTHTHAHTHTANIHRCIHMHVSTHIHIICSTALIDTHKHAHTCIQTQADNRWARTQTKRSTHTHPCMCMHAHTHKFEC